MTESKMELLVRVQYRHGYFKNSTYPCLSARPGPDAVRTMINEGLVLKTASGGFQLLYDARHAGGTRSRRDVLATGVSLRLPLWLNDPFFYNYTAPVAADISRHIFYFYNRPGRCCLHADKLVSEKDLIPFENTSQAISEKPFALVHLQLREDLPENGYVLFPKTYTWWNYILVGEHLQYLHKPAIINNRTREVFTGPVTVSLPGRRTGLSFVSPKPMALKEAVPVTCCLVENFEAGNGKYRTIMDTLPAPDVRILSRLPNREEGANKGKTLSEIFLY